MQVSSGDCVGANNIDCFDNKESGLIYNYYKNSIISKPNVMLTTGGGISIRRYDNNNFMIYYLYMTSIFIIDMKIKIVTLGGHDNHILNYKEFKIKV